MSAPHLENPQFDSMLLISKQKILCLFHLFVTHITTDSYTTAVSTISSSSSTSIMVLPTERFTSLTEMADLVVLGKIESAIFHQVRGTVSLSQRIEDVRHVLSLQPRSTLDLSKCTSKNCMIRTLYDELGAHVERMERSIYDKTHSNEGMSLATRVEQLVGTVVNGEIHKLELDRFHLHPYLNNSLEELRLTPEEQD